MLEAWRGGTSSFEVLLVDNGLNQPPVATDHFRDALARVPPERRTPDPKAVADHLLFGAVPGAHTFVAAIGRLGHGEHYRWQNGRTERNIFDPLVARPRPDVSPLDGIDAGLQRAIGRLPVGHDCVTQLSGGIDSALLHTYLPAGTPTVSGAIDSPEFARECAYAEQASRLLGSQAPDIHGAGERLSELAGGRDPAGRPADTLSTAGLLQLDFQVSASRFVNGEFGDMPFGLKRPRPISTPSASASGCVCRHAGVVLLPQAKCRGAAAARAPAPDRDPYRRLAGLGATIRHLCQCRVGRADHRSGDDAAAH
jgi:hypothetical protein